jgi:DNA-binding transcriptional LysR family regulator
MSHIDWSSLDAKLLHLLVAVVEEGSVTAAAHRLGVTQSTVSHLLDKLRAITGDPLFVKSGRGIVATARAEGLAPQARALLHELRRFAQRDTFDPAALQATLTIAANDFQRDLLLPAFAARLRERAPGVMLRIIPSTVPRLDMLRSDQCQLVISPRPPDGTDVVQKRLFEDRYRVFYDPAVRNAPRTRAEYLASDHATVVYEPRRSLDLDQQLLAQGIDRRFTPLLATLPGLLERHTLRHLASVRPPVACPGMPMYLIWHLRYQQDAAHRWFREQLDAIVGPALAQRAPG